MPKKDSRPGNPGAATSPSPKYTNDFDFDQRVVHQVDSSIWRAIYAGEFRLAVKCRRCGRWLTDGRSKRAHMGKTCASKAVGK